ncbi:ABC transporter ATP-binding protein [Salibacterium salarium]|uniref:Carnitine transport ATP-binding protein OpuCA n=1 Tax=Salibacterium salarium TaxID=284579 RepID=A0A3R9QJK6_9BACI|nr:ABC transporter ATP-binding protein [Salibacterium salarium]RSL31869.1 ABC transporter ATP-binding protein [Salibacterium salarium]
MSEQPILQLKKIEKSFGETAVLRNITLDVQEGELVTFIGPSGSGKTTLLRVVGGFHQQTGGTVLLGGQTIDVLPPEKRSTGMVFQNYALFPHMTVYENVEYGLKIQTVGKVERNQRIKEALQQVQLDGYENRKPSELSGGQQQRVAIARCLVLKPKVLLLDEPLSNLDANLRVVMRDEIRRLKEELNLTIVFVTHDQEEALSISDRILVLKDGIVQQLETPSIVYQRPANEFVAKFVGHANLLEGTFTVEGEETYFQTKGNGLRFPVEIEGPVSESGTILLRPEMMNRDSASPYQGTVDKTVYHGNYVRYYFSMDGESLFLDDNNPFHTNLLQKGDQINVAFPRRLHVLPNT